MEFREKNIRKSLPTLLLRNSRLEFTQFASICVYKEGFGYEEIIITYEIHCLNNPEKNLVTHKKDFELF